LQFANWRIRLLVGTYIPVRTQFLDLWTPWVRISRPPWCRPNTGKRRTRPNWPLLPLLEPISRHMVGKIRLSTCRRPSGIWFSYIRVRPIIISRGGRVRNYTPSQFTSIILGRIIRLVSQFLVTVKPRAQRSSFKLANHADAGVLAITVFSFEKQASLLLEVSSCRDFETSRN
jgi:hypothetical protein